MITIIHLCLALLLFATGMLAQKNVTVIAIQDNLLGTPDVKGKVVSTVKQDELLELLIERESWYLVQSKDFVGWIKATSISINRFDNFTSGIGSGGGQGSGRGTGTGDGNGAALSITKPIRILSKPRPAYTDDGKKNDVRGSVILRVTFLASGEIGSVQTVRGLPYGLTEQAIIAARKIRFEPAEANGVPISVTKTIEFSFVPNW